MRKSLLALLAACFIAVLFSSCIVVVDDNNGDGIITVYEGILTTTAFEKMNGRIAEDRVYWDDIDLSEFNEDKKGCNSYRWNKEKIIQWMMDNLGSDYETSKTFAERFINQEHGIIYATGNSKPNIVFYLVR